MDTRTDLSYLIELKLDQKTLIINWLHTIINFNFNSDTVRSQLL